MSCSSWQRLAPLRLHWIWIWFLTPCSFPDGTAPFGRLIRSWRSGSGTDAYASPLAVPASYLLNPRQQLMRVPSVWRPRDSVHPHNRRVCTRHSIAHTNTHTPPQLPCSGSLAVSCCTVSVTVRRAPRDAADRLVDLADQSPAVVRVPGTLSHRIVDPSGVQKLSTSYFKKKAQH